ncbi:EAL domain-containing protein [Actinomadura parmotrematis]|uniref:EAL domain-containing protein n=1 Tax=Actinomadura parmotrematis TaxID=2864039 RepID=A0ABS7FUN2_9ACTN|nr:EAL domain-containing protein [Actinomadura parmotrematis]MBW8483297.1 EAL domain-containing protein [Actinomadura parmotrematis]
MSALEVRLPARAAYRPVVDLGSGAVVAVEPQPEPDALPGGDPAARDVQRAIDAAHAGAATRLPLALGVRAETLAAGETALDALHRGLTGTGRRPRELLLCVGGGFAPAQRPAVSAGLRALRHAGYLVGIAGLGAAHAPLDLLVEGVPYLVRLDADLARRAVTDPGRTSLVTVLVDLAHRIGAHVLAPGLDHRDQVLRMRELGVRLVQGPALAPPEWQPGMPVSVPVAPPAPARADPGLGPRVAEYTLPAVTMPDTATADEVLEVLNAEAGTSSVVLVDGRQRPQATVDRTRFLLRLSGAYGHALHAHKPAARLADAPRPIPHTVPAIAALRAAGAEDDRVYDDLVVVDEVGRCLGIVRVADLIRGLAAR